MMILTSSHYRRRTLTASNYRMPTMSLLLCCLLATTCFSVAHAQSLYGDYIPDDPYSSLLERMKGPLLTDADDSASTQSRLLQETAAAATNVQVFSVKCRMTMVDFLYADLNNELSQRVEQVGCIPLDYASHLELDLVLVMEVPQHVYDTYRQGINSGTIMLQFDHVMLASDDDYHDDDDDDDGQETLVVLDDAVSELQVDASHRSLLLAPAPTTGNMTVYIVRVSASDSSPNMTLVELQDRLFDSTLPNFQSQYRQCSMNQLQLSLAGGMDIFVDAPIGNFSTGMGIVTLAEAYLRQATGVASVADLADRVLYCVAPGTSDPWIASAAVRHWRAIFNNEWCASLSGAMHELAHTLGLLHSGEDGSKYGDQTGYMGYGSISDISPQKCFNGYQSWQMGWYAARQKNLDVFFEPGLYNLVAFVEYPLALETEQVLLIIDDTYFLQYNLAEGFNIDTTEMRDEVTIIMPTGEGTTAVGSLLPGANFTIDNYKETGLPLIIHACSERPATGGLANAMVVAVGLGRSYCSEAPQEVGIAPPQCMARHSPCTDNGNCCNALKCLGDDFRKICSSCRSQFSQCQQTPDCCDGLTCDLGMCRAAVVQKPLGLTEPTVTTTTTTTSTSSSAVSSYQAGATASATSGRAPQCQRRKKTCANHGECCGDLRCIVMIHPKCRKCRRKNMICNEDMDCCDKLSCSSGVCQRLKKKT